jgi:hypothetical protein
MTDGQEERLTGPIVQTVIDSMPAMKNAGNLVVTYREEEDGETLRVSGGNARSGTDKSQSFTRKLDGTIEVIEQYGLASARTIIPVKGPVMTDRGRWNAAEKTHQPGTAEKVDEDLAAVSRLIGQFQIPRVFEAVAQVRADMRQSQPRLQPPRPKLPGM